MNDILNDKVFSKSVINGTNEGVYFPELDGLRFFAFLLVFIHHHQLFSGIPYISVFHTYGWIGVDLFFILSAYLFTKLLIAENEKTKTINFKKFYIRRIFRIWPIYYLLIVLSVLYIFLDHGTLTKITGVRILGLIAFSDNIMSGFNGYNPMPFIIHLWTISYEEQFYILIPIIIYLLIRSSFKAKMITLASTFILLNAIRFVLITNTVPHPAIYVLPITHFESIVLGIVIGFDGLDLLLKRINSLILCIIGILFFVFLCQLPNLANISYKLIASYSFVGISTALILYSVLNNKFFKEVFSKKIFVFLGKRSYGLYVYHLLGNLVAQWIINHISIIPSNSLASFLYSLSFTVLLSIVSYRFIEKPFLIMKKKFEIITSRPV